MRQTGPTKKAATDFGIAVKCSAVVRSFFRPLLPEPANRSIIYKTDAAFRKWLKENPLDNTEPVNGIPYFNDLSFNDSCDLQKILQLKISISRGADGGLLLQWPTFNPVTAIKAPTGTKQIVVKYIIATLDMNNAGQNGCAETAFTIPFTNDMIPSKEIQFENATGLKRIALVGMAVRYYKDDLQSQAINILRWKPAGIVSGFYN